MVPNFKPASLSDSKLQSLFRSFSTPISFSSFKKPSAFTKKINSDRCLGILR